MNPVTIVAFIRRWIVELILLVSVITLSYLMIEAKVEARGAKARAEAAEKAKDDALMLAAVGKDAAERAKALDGELAQTKAQLAALLTKVGGLEAELAKRPMPPKPGPAPQGLEQVVADLKTMGTSPETIGREKLAFPAQDGPVLWTWGKESARVPALELRLGTSEALSASLKEALSKSQEQSAKLQTQNSELTKAATGFESAFKSEKTQSGVLKVEVAKAQTERDRARKTRIYIGIGAFVGGLYLGAKH